jgi:hypothetical protein
MKTPAKKPSCEFSMYVGKLTTINEERLLIPKLVWDR